MFCVWLNFHIYLKFFKRTRLCGSNYIEGGKVSPKNSSIERKHAALASDDLKYTEKSWSCKPE